MAITQSKAEALRDHVVTYFEQTVATYRPSAVRKVL